MALSKRRPIIIGNWKLNKTVAQALELASSIRNVLGGLSADLEVGIAPPFTALSAVARRVEGSRLIVAAQNCHHADEGAFTGEVSAPLLADVGCTHVIVGHSERRQLFGEDDGTVNNKVHAVLRSSLVPVLCVGELLSEREAGRTFDVVSRQLEGALAGVSREAGASVVVAYEPVWAIGTGKVASTAQAQEVHGFLRTRLATLFGAETAERIRLQYGGSVKPDNVQGLMAQPDIDGALVGGASLQAESFIEILKYTRE
ncbi:MAG: triose-phosphate isomerase [Deltaproteobacteria bacterium]|nr:triose-phosphate isomerase [Deltaproteobacteria bacterium]